MKRAIIIHGWEGTPHNEWMPWLGSALEKAGYSVEIPQMPNTKSPKLHEWMETLLMLGPDEDTVLIGHSLANALIMKYLEKPNAKAKKAIMVAAWDWLMEDVREFHETFFETGFDYAAIKKKQVPVVIVNSTNDPWIDFEKAKKLADKISAQLITVENAGHFMERDGYKEFPLLVEIVK